MKQELEARVRSHPVCPLCYMVKGAGLVTCWACYRAHGLRNGNPTAMVRILRFGERLMEINGGKQ